MHEHKEDLTDTKSLPVFTIEFDSYFRLKLRQHNNSGSHGTTVWDSAKLLAFYLFDTFKKPSFKDHQQHINQNSNGAANCISTSVNNTKTCLELGSGCGLGGLTMASLGFSTVLTDLPNVIQQVLDKNCQDASADILDWWYHLHHTTSDLLQPPKIIVKPFDWLKLQEEHDTSDLKRRHDSYDYILASDCIYEIELVEPLLRCIRHHASPTTVTLIAVERRDDAVIDGFIEKAKVFGFDARMVLRKHLRNSLVDNEDVEIWKLKLKRNFKGL